MYLKPTSPEVRVPDPAQAGTPGYFLPAEGRELEPSLYWSRRLIDGDVIEVAPPAAGDGSAPVVSPASAPGA